MYKHLFEKKILKISYRSLMGAASECRQICLLGGNSLANYCSQLFTAEPHAKADAPSAHQLCCSGDQ